MDTSLFDELENFGKEQGKKEEGEKKQNVQVSQSNQQPSAMDKLLRDASEYDKESVKKASSRQSMGSKNKDTDFNEDLLEG